MPKRIISDHTQNTSKQSSSSPDYQQTFPKIKRARSLHSTSSFLVVRLLLCFCLLLCCIVPQENWKATNGTPFISWRFLFYFLFTLSLSSNRHFSYSLILFLVKKLPAALYFTLFECWKKNISAWSKGLLFLLLFLLLCC